MNFLFILFLLSCTINAMPIMTVKDKLTAGNIKSASTQVNPASGSLVKRSRKRGRENDSELTQTTTPGADGENTPDQAHNVASSLPSQPEAIDPTVLTDDDSDSEDDSEVATADCPLCGENSEDNDPAVFYNL
jgi:hypothetical protein